MASLRTWRSDPVISGPEQIQLADIPALNTVFSDAFSERYRKDGLVGVRVPFLNPLIWRYAIEGAGSGAVLWRTDRGGIAAFNIAHRSGDEGWMGPLAVMPDLQSRGVGRAVVEYGVEHLRSHGCRVIGLETMPRTMDNIGFYSQLGFVPGPLTITVTLDAATVDSPITLLGKLSPMEREAAIDECSVLTGTMRAGYDFTREIRITEALSIGETILLWRGTQLVAFAICHSAPLVEGRTRDEVRVLKFVARTDADALLLVTHLCEFARRCGTRRVAIRVQGDAPRFYAELIARGGRVRWTDLRMTMATYAEPQQPGDGVMLSNWEI
jgi:GNAT superfamily N-acetyltransferase